MLESSSKSIQNLCFHCLTNHAQCTRGHVQKIEFKKGHSNNTLSMVEIFGKIIEFKDNSDIIFFLKFFSI